MGLKNWKIILSIALIGLSFLLHLLHYYIFRDAHHIFLYLLGDLAFLPVSVLFVTLVVEHLIQKQEKHSMFKKLNMVIGAFFSEAGTELLSLFWKFDADPEYLKTNLIFNKDWKQNDYYVLKKIFNSHKPELNIHKGDITHLKIFLNAKKEFFLRLLENPNLLEHETFTALLWAVFHLTEELCARPDFKNLPQADYEHLAGDIKRAYSLLIVEWIVYMRHLHNNYPYLYSLAVRTNPFDIKASVIIGNR
jgi:hypothetical protein